MSRLNSKRTLRLDGSSLTIESAYLAEKERAKLTLTQTALRNMERSRRQVEKWLAGD